MERRACGGWGGESRRGEREGCNEHPKSQWLAHSRLFSARWSQTGPLAAVHRAESGGGPCHLVPPPAVSAGRWDREPGHRAVLTPALGELGSGPHKAGRRSGVQPWRAVPSCLSCLRHSYRDCRGRTREKGGDTSRLRGAHMLVGTQMQTNMQWVSWGDRWWDRLREEVPFEQGSQVGSVTNICWGHARASPY